MMNTLLGSWGDVMKKHAKTLIKGLILTILFSLITVRISHTSTPFTVYRPVYLSFEALRSGVTSELPRDLKDPGKILIKDQFIFISERFEGVHIFDNSDPENPAAVAFIQIPGNIDLAMRNNILYADSYVDLVALDVTDPKAVLVTERLENIYPNKPFVEEGTVWDEEIDRQKGVVVGREPVRFDDGSQNGDDDFLGCSRGD